jgi:hypothetical protein
MNDCARLGWTRRDRRLEPVIFSRRASRSSSFAKRTAFQKGGPRHPNWVVLRMGRVEAGRALRSDGRATPDLGGSAICAGHVGINRGPGRCLTTLDLRFQM